MKPIDWHDSKGRTCSHCKKWMQYPECPYESFQARHPGPNPDDEPCGQFYLNWYRTDEYMKGKVMNDKPAPQRPSMGRMVYLCLESDKDTTKFERFSAVITGVQVIDGNYFVSLQVFWDPMRRVDNNIKYYANVAYSDEPADQTWSWPPRV